MIQIIPVVLCGGSGTRLWPLSRTGFPKQFLVLEGTQSLFQQALQRVHDLDADDITVGRTLLVANEEHRFLALDQLRELKVVTTMILEPAARNTAPALTLAALQATENGSDPVLVVTPADQTVTDHGAFKTALQNAVRAAADGSIVILGVTPDRAETGYGYIKRSLEGHDHEAYPVAAFIEKPALEQAENFLAAGEYSWNSGMFVLRASTWLKALAQMRPDISTTVQVAWAGKKTDSEFIRPASADYAVVPNVSVDYAVIEHCPNAGFGIKVVHLDAGWNDLGAWDSVWKVGKRDDNGNVTKGNTLLTATSNTLIHATSRLVSAVGVDDLVIVETPDAVLVANKSSSQDVKKIVALLGHRQSGEENLHRKVHRPWGWYDSIDEEERFKVKRIQVKPGASLSLQKHHHRAEHWIVVRGTAQVTCGEKVVLLTENQSTYIPLGEVHRLANPGTIPLEIIEVQSGSYLGEDDIVRFEDTYGRS